MCIAATFNNFLKLLAASKQVAYEVAHAASVITSQRESFRTLFCSASAASCTKCFLLYSFSVCACTHYYKLVVPQAFQAFLWDNAGSAALGMRPMQRKDTTSFQQSDLWPHQSYLLPHLSGQYSASLLCLSTSFDPPLPVHRPSPFVTFSQIPSFREKVSGG